MSERTRILVVQGRDRLANPIQTVLDQGEVVRAANVSEALALMSRDHFDMVCADSADPTLRTDLGDLAQGRQLLEALTAGVALVDASLEVVWSNASFEACCGGPVRGRGFYEALGSPEILGPDYSPFHTALAGHPATTRLHAPNSRFLDLHVSLVTRAEGQPAQMVTLVHDVTEEVHQQQVIAALHKAGGELASLAPEELADMSVEERVELLKANLRRLVHDLLHYDIIEIRLLDCKTGRLEALLEEGVTPEAANRVLYAQPRGNGVTGLVAATGKSYLCPDTAADPLYLEGGAGAQSSLTVPLVRDDQVIGTFNVESLKPNAFCQRDVQFAEIFARDVAAALRTLDLLTAEKQSTALRSIEAINRNVVVPLDNILSAAAALLDRDPAPDQEMCSRLRQILASGRTVKELIRKAGEDQVCPQLPEVSEGAAHLGLKGKRILVVDADKHSGVRPTGCSAAGDAWWRPLRTPARLWPWPTRLPTTSSWPTSACRTAAAMTSSVTCARPSPRLASS